MLHSIRIELHSAVFNARYLRNYVTQSRAEGKCVMRGMRGVFSKDTSSGNTSGITEYSVSLSACYFCDASGENRNRSVMFISTSVELNRD